MQNHSFYLYSPPPHKDYGYSSSQLNTAYLIAFS